MALMPTLDTAAEAVSHKATDSNHKATRRPATAKATAKLPTRVAAMEVVAMPMVVAVVPPITVPMVLPTIPTR